MTTGILQIVLLSYMTIFKAAASERNALLHVSSRVKTDTFCITHIFQHQPLPTSLNEAVPSELVDLSQSKGCTLQDYPTRVRLANSTVGLLSGSCGHAQKSGLVQVLNGRGVLIIETEAELPSNSTEDDAVDIDVATIAWDDYRQLFQHKRPIVLRMYAGQKPPWDPNMIIVVLLSTSLVMAGAGWAACKEHKSRRTSKMSEQGPRQISKLMGESPRQTSTLTDLFYRQTSKLTEQGFRQTSKLTDQGPRRASQLTEQGPRQASKLTEQSPRQSSKLTEQTECSRKWASVFTVASWVTLHCAIIVLLYLCYAQMVYFIIGMFCFFGSLHLYLCMVPAWSRILPVIYEINLNKVPCFKTKLKLRNMLLYLSCLSLGIFWVVQRHATYAWAIQDLLGASLCIVCIKKVRISSARNLAALMAFFVAYDVFFVFITPLITKDGDSIMLKIATGASSHMDSGLAPESGPQKETLPIMFLIPLLSKNPLATCGKRSFSILGLGDVFIPGLIVTFSSVFDVRSGTRMVYYLASSLGYFCGIVICMITLVVTGTGQPALLYLIPCTLLALVATALIRGELRELILGSRIDPKTTQDVHANVAEDEVEDETEEEEESLNKDTNKLVS